MNLLVIITLPIWFPLIILHDLYWQIKEGDFFK